ncbi:hypothetical protein ADL27_52125 [Streptomyces sp. NRRL F-6602]|nr:hypothetical protein ADL27_52125 [Streptomyces sp. NRRL F-6602]
MEPTPPEYLPMPDGYAQRVTELEAEGHATARAHWMAACEASGAVARRESNHRDLFWFGETSDENREAWERIADREGKRFYFHQKKDTLVGWLAHRRHEERTNAELHHKRGERLAAFLREKGLWGEWTAYNRAKRGLDTEEQP